MTHWVVSMSCDTHDGWKKKVVTPTETSPKTIGMYMMLTTLDNFSIVTYKERTQDIKITKNYIFM